MTDLKEVIDGPSGIEGLYPRDLLAITALENIGRISIVPNLFTWVPFKGAQVGFGLSVLPNARPDAQSTATYSTVDRQRLVVTGQKELSMPRGTLMEDFEEACDATAQEFGEIDLWQILDMLQKEPGRVDERVAQAIALHAMAQVTLPLSSGNAEAA